MRWTICSAEVYTKGAYKLVDKDGLRIGLSIAISWLCLKYVVLLISLPETAWYFKQTKKGEREVFIQIIKMLHRIFKCMPKGLSSIK